MAATLAVVFALGSTSLPAYAEGSDSDADSAISITKTAGATPDGDVASYAPGDTVTYDIVLACVAPTAGVCVDARVVDDIPAPLILQDVTVADPDNLYDDNSDGDTVDVAFSFTNDQGAGMRGGNSVTIAVTAEIPETITWEQAQELGEVTNTASFTTRDLSASDDAVLVIDVPEQLAADATKSAEDNMGGTGRPIPAEAGRPVDFTIGGGNTSNRPVESITITDPAAGSTGMEYLDLTSIDGIAYPAGADQVTVSYVDGTGTHTIGPYFAPTDSVLLTDFDDPTTVTSISFTFTAQNGDQLPPATGPGDYASIGIGTETNELVEDLDTNESVTVDNVAEATVTVDDRTQSDTASDSVVITNVPPSVTVDKSFADAALLPGETTTATIEAVNGGKDVTEMTIADPGAGGDDLHEQGFAFQGFDEDAIVWPSDADHVQITYYYASAPTEETLESDDLDTLPTTSRPDDVVGFSITFTGPIEPGATAVVPFVVESQPVEEGTPTQATNTTDASVVDADGVGATDTDSDTITRNPARVYPVVDKSIVKDDLYNAPGASTLVQLTGSVREDSTTGADELVVQDPIDPDGGISPFWNHFDLTSIGPVEVPTNATMTASYYSCAAGDWVPFPGMPVAPGDTWSYVIPGGDKDDICGVQFVYTPDPAGTLLPPGFTVLAYFNVELRDELRDGSGPVNSEDVLAIDNDASATVDNPETGQGPQTDTDTDGIDVIPIDGEGPDMISKSWTPTSGVVALSGDTTPVTLQWGTQGIPLDTMTITDIENPETTELTDSAFDAFDLRLIQEITPATDPGILFDQVYAQRLSAASGQWEYFDDGFTAANPSRGGYPEYRLSAQERDDTIAVRFVFSERPDRADVITNIATDPAVGSGVAETDGLDRTIILRYALRYYLRSNPAQPVLGANHEYEYNSGTPGIVDNTVQAEGVGTDDTYNSRAEDDMTILDEAMDVTLDKRFVDYDENADNPWDDSLDSEELPLPPVGTPASDYPGMTALLRATNTSVARVGSMTVRDPDPDITEGIYDQFNLFRVVSVTVPEGADASLSRVILSFADGPAQSVPLDDPILSNPSSLADVVGVTVTHSGGLNGDGTYSSLIVSGATSDIRLEYQMRPTLRSDPDTAASATVTPLINHAVVDESRPGADAVGPITETTSDTASDDISIVTGTYGVETSKTIDPETRSELDPAEGYTVELTGQPTGTIPSTRMTMTDASPTFFNAFVFSAFADIDLPNPIQQVRVDLLSGADVGLDGDTLAYACGGDTDLTACWTEGAWVTADTAGGVISAAALAGSIDVPFPDIQGVRFTFRTSGEVHWERPSDPLITTTFVADRREFLVYDGTDDGVDTLVPTTRPGLDAAPGEDVAGVMTDDVVTVVESSWNDEGTSPFTETATESDTTTLTHVANSVSVSKVHGREAAGTNQDTFYPGEEIPYEITVVNTGDWPITGLTVTDQVETDGDGPMLVEPARAVDDDTPIYTGTLDGTPIDPFAGGMDADGLITFELPDDFVFEPGAELVVTASLVFRQTPEPVSPGVEVGNAVSVSSDRYFDTCEFTTHGDATTPTTDVPACASTTQATPRAVGPISTVKSVKGVGAGVEGAAPGDANYDDLGVLGVNVSDPERFCDEPNVGDGYYLTPCVPLTRPGGVEQWRLQLTNAGNVPVSTIAAIDVLPGVGDTGVTLPGQRGSRWQPTYLGNLVTSGQLNGATPSVWYSTVVPNQACNEAEIQYLTGGISAALAACTDEVVNQRPSMWQPYSNALPAEVLADIRALRFSVTYDEGLELQPNATVQVTFQSQTAWSSEQIEQDPNGVDPIAWNGAAAGSVGQTPLGQVQSPVVEPRKAGVALATGQLQFEKAVEGLDPAWGVDAPDDYAFTLACTSGGEPVSLVGPGGADMSQVRVASDGTPLAYNAGTGEWGQVTLPLYAECTLTEDAGDPNSQGAIVTYDPAGAEDGTSGAVQALRFEYADNIVNAPAADDPGEATIAATNTYVPGGFEITKSIDDGGVRAPIAYEDTYDFTAQCTFLGQSVLDEEFTLSEADGWTEEFGDLPAGAECTVEEVDPGGAASTTIVVTEDGVAGDEETAASVDFTVLAYDEGETTALTTVAVTNVYTTGSVLVTKTIVDPGGWGTADFTVEMTCTLEGATPDPVFEGSSTVSADSPEWQVDDLPTGAECVVTETENGGANATSPDVTVVVGDDESGVVEAEITNTFTVGSLRVTKVLEGAPANALDPATTDEYAISLSCTREVNGVPDVPVVIPAPGADRTIVGAGSVVYEGLPTGAECTVSEDDPGFATGEVRISPDPVMIGGPDDDPVEVTVTNVFENGSLSVVKAFDAPDGFPTPDSFTATVTCTWQGADVPLADDGAITIAGDGTPTIVDDIPVDSVCEIEEDDFGQTSVTYLPAQSIVVDDPDAPTEVAIENTYEWASLEVGKLVESDSPFIPTQFEFHVVCTFQDGTPVDETFFLDANETETITEIPARSECTVTETGERGADSTITEADVPGATGDLAPQIDQATRTVVIPELQPDSTAVINTVTYTNLYDTTAVVLVKEFAGAGADQFGLDQAFVFSVTCTLEGETVLDRQVALSAANGFTTALTEVVAGSECTVVEDDLQGADTVVIEPNDGEDTTVGDVVIPAEGALVTVTATNWYLTGSLEVTKTFAGDGVEKYGTDDFGLNLACLRDGEVVDIPDGADRVVNAGEPVADWTHLPTGAECTLTETDAGGANSTAIQDENGDPVTLDEDGGYTFVVTTDPTILSEDDQVQPALTVENTFNLAQVSVSKTVDNGGALDIDGEPVAYGPFEVTLACTWNGQDVTAAEPMVRTIADGETVTWTQLPEAADCTIAETDTMGAAATTVTVTQAAVTGDPLVGTIADLDPLPNVDADDQTSVAILNQFLDPPITVRKVVDGGGAGEFGDRSFTFDVRCVLIDPSHPAPGLLLRDGRYEVGGPIGPLVTRLPTGAECSITEVDTGGADRTTITINGVPLTGTTATTVIGSVPVEILVTNTFDAPLPSTGFDARGVWIAGGVAALLIVGGLVAVLVVRRRRRTE
ncbi:DUF5979 domain-containing protein [Microbacterium terricola]|uniref:DUF5979 domain-containing protein n=1 Tax=Microbacterium terricola TaxID=344163 RepID=A0ABM8DUW9_9MICO|nr:DUF5979 domain-containing protein [Microbacterium terricola]UYK39845.1 DUF5979 domain-containing protein [Microbacterium terricola]BDV29402.1 hypothetical protein Microterr_00620 [Microbacterium terricola]